jgi:tripartite-type tricarboxylate transporter receptor subunit TctC
MRRATLKLSRLKSNIKWPRRQFVTAGHLPYLRSLVRATGVRNIAAFIVHHAEATDLAHMKLLLTKPHRAPRLTAGPLIAAALVLALARPAPAESVEDFYRGRTVTVLISYSVGGGYDLYARLLARYLGNHIPGNPAIVPQNMPGAGGLRAANYLYSAAPKDGSIIGTFSRSIPTMPLVTPKDAHFDGRKFSWIGSMSGDTSLCLTGAKSQVKTFDDMLTKPVVMGGQFAAADSDIYAHLYKNLFGAKIKLVSGYPGTNDITLAMERGEVDGICGLSWGTLKVAHRDWIANKSVHILVQAALKKDPELPDVPLALDLIKDPEKRQILYLDFAPQAIGRPFAAPPGIPADRKAALIKAFDETMKDPALLAEAARAKMDIGPMTGPDIDKLLAELYAIPPDIIAKASKAIAE